MTVNNKIWTFKPGHLSLHLTQLIITINNGIVNLSTRSMKTFWNNTFWSIRFFFFETFLWGLHGIAKLEFVWLQDRYFLQLFLVVFVVVLTCQLTLLKSWVSFDFDFKSLLANCGYVGQYMLIQNDLLCIFYFVSLLRENLALKMTTTRVMTKFFYHHFFLVKMC